jgi:hypothetical protein
MMAEIDVRQQVHILDTSKFHQKWASGLKTGKSKLYRRTKNRHDPLIP